MPQSISLFPPGLNTGMRAPVLLEMKRRRWPTTTVPMVMVVVVVVLSSLAPGTLTAPSEDFSLEDTVRVLRHFSAGVGTRRGAGSGRQSTGASHGSFRGQQSLRGRLDSLEVNDNSREDPSRLNQHRGNRRDDFLSLERESLEVVVGASAVPAGGTSRSQEFYSQYFTVGDDDHSIEIDDDDFRFMNLGRRYHPDGLSPVSPQQLYIPQPATRPASMRSAASRRAPSHNNPFIIATASSSEDSKEDNPYEDDDDDNVAISISKNLLNVKGEDSSEERLELDDALLKKRYHFIDGQGSQSWGYDQVDQYQHHAVNTDGTMKGRFGWTSPNGQEIRVQYVADEGGYRVVDSYGLHPVDNEDVRKVKAEHAEIHRNIANRRPVAPLPTHMSGGVPLPPVDGNSYKVTIPFGGAGVPLLDPRSDISLFQGSSGFSGVGVPLPPHQGSGVRTSVGVSLPPHQGSGVRTAVGVPLPPHQGSGVRTSVGVSLPPHQGSGVGTAGVPLPTQAGAGSGGISLSVPSGQPSGGVPLPSPSGPGAAPSGPFFGGDDDSVVAGTIGGVALPGMPGVGTSGVSLSDTVGQGAGGVPLPSPSRPGATLSGTGGVALPSPSRPGATLSGTGGVALPSPSGPGATLSGTGGVALPSPFGPGATPSGTGGVALPSPSGPGTTLSGTGGVALPSPSGPGATLSGTGGVALPSPSGPGATLSGTGGVALPSPSGPGATLSGTGGVALPSPSGPGATLSGTGGVALPSPSGPGATLSGTGGVALPSPSGPGAAPSGPGFFGDDVTVVVGATGGVALSDMPGAGAGGVPLPSPSRPGVAPSGPGFLGDGDSVVAGTTGGVGLPGSPELEQDTSGISFSMPVGPGTGGVPLPSPSGTETAPSGPGFFGDGETVDVGVGGGVGLSGMPRDGASGFSFTIPVGPGAGGVPLPSPSGSEAIPSGPSFGDDLSIVAGAAGGGGVGLPQMPGAGDATAGSPGFEDSTFGVGGTGSEVGGSMPDFGAGGSMPDFGAGGSMPDFGAGGSMPDFGAGGGVPIPGFGSSPGFGAFGPEGGASEPGAGAGVSLVGLGSSNNDPAGRPGFDDFSNGFGVSGPGQGVSRPGAGAGVSLPDFGSNAGDAAGRPGFDDFSNGFGVFGPGQGVSGPGAGAGVSLPDFGSNAGDAAGRPGFDVSSTNLGASMPSFNGGGVPLSVFGPIDNERPVGPGPNGDFGFTTSVGSSDGFDQGFGGMGYVGGVPLNSGFGGSARFNGAPGTASPGFGRGALDASEVPLQGPPVPGTFFSTNVGQANGFPGVPLNTPKSMSFNKNLHFQGQFFEVGPPEPVQHATGGPISASPSPSLPHSTTLDFSRPNQINLPSGPVFEPSLFTESSSKLPSESDKPQDLVKVYHDIYGIEMRQEDWAAPSRREALPANSELPAH